MIPITIYKYKDTGKYTKSNPKIERKEIKAGDEHEARRNAFEEARIDDWWVLRVEIGPKEIA